MKDHIIAAYDGKTNRLIAIRPDPTNLLFLKECPNIDVAVSGNLFNFDGYSPQLSNVTCNEWVISPRTMKLTQDDVQLSSEFVYLCTLSRAILSTYEEILKRINFVRRYIKPGGNFLFGADIHHAKLKEAESLKKGEAVTLTFLQAEADMLEVDVSALADTVIFEEHLRLSFLQKSELLRIKYLGQLKEVTTVEQCSDILALLDRDLYGTRNI